MSGFVLLATIGESVSQATSNSVSVTLSIGDWIKIIALVVTNTGALLAALWKFSGRLASMETKIDGVMNSQLADHDSRISRLEAPYFTQKHSKQLP